MHKENCINFPMRTVFPSYRHVSSNSLTGSIRTSYLFRSAEGSVGVSRFHSRAASKQETVSSARFPLISTLAGQTLMKNPHSSWPSYPSPALSLSPFSSILLFFLKQPCVPRLLLPELNNILSSRRRRKSKSRLRDERKKRAEREVKRRRSHSAVA